MNRRQINSSARLAGQVERYHCWPVHRRQSVAEHTWHVMRIYWQIWGPLPEIISTHLLWHDAGELATGDLPFPVKARNPAVKVILDVLEADAVEAMGGPAGLEPNLSDQDRIRMKISDLLEMWEFGCCELAMGNQYAQPIVDDTYQAARALLEKLTPRDRELVAVYVSKRGEGVALCK